MKLFLPFVVSVYAQDADWPPPGFNEDCPVVNQALLCHGSCEEDFKSCLQNCESEADVQCILACADVYDECEIKCPCRIDGECESGCPCPSFECEPVCEDAVDLEGSKDCIDWCFTAANETYTNCLYPEITTGSPLPTALPEPETFAAKDEPLDLLPDFELCKKVAKEWSLECQMGCPCNPNCPTCSEMENTCNAEFCPAIATTTAASVETTTAPGSGDGGSASSMLLNTVLATFAFILVK